jgi:hypothetical protein
MTNVIENEKERVKAGVGEALVVLAVSALGFILENINLIFAGIVGLVISLILYKLISKRHPRVALFFSIVAGTAIVFINPSQTIIIGFSFACGIGALSALVYGLIGWESKERNASFLSAVYYGILALPFLNVLTPVGPAKDVMRLVNRLLEASVNRKMAAMSGTHCPGQAMRFRLTPVQGTATAWFETWCGRAGLDEQIKNGTFTKYYPMDKSMTPAKAEEGRFVNGDNVGVWTFWDRAGKVVKQKNYGDPKAVPSEPVPTGMLVLLCVTGIAAMFFGAGSAPLLRKYAEKKASSESENISGDFDPLQVLGVSPNASEDEIHRSYRELAKRYHPDAVASLAPEFKKVADRRMKEINNAYDSLRKKSAA